jgi:hypothetical protein
LGLTAITGVKAGSNGYWLRKCSVLKQVEVYAIGGICLKVFIFWILKSKNRAFHEIAKHL